MKYSAIIVTLLALAFSLAANGLRLGSLSRVAPLPHTKASLVKLNAIKDNVSDMMKSGESSSSYTKDIQKTAAWFAASSAFCGLVYQIKGVDGAVEFASGYFLEQALSIDNLFVFILLFGYFRIPKEDEPRILNYGIFGAIILRGIFIGLGAAIVEQFQQVFLVFAVILGVASYGILFPGFEEEEDISKNAVIKFTQKFLRTTDKLDGDRFFTTVDGVSMATPLLLCLICIELSDIVFAFDSVPAIFGITQDPLIVYTSNIFSIASLRALYGILSSAVENFKYLEKAVGIVLAVISVKLAGSAFDYEVLTPVQSLVVVLTLLGGGVALSILDSKQNNSIRES